MCVHSIDYTHKVFGTLNACCMHTCMSEKCQTSMLYMLHAIVMFRSLPMNMHVHKLNFFRVVFVLMSTWQKLVWLGIYKHTLHCWLLTMMLTAHESTKNSAHIQRSGYGSTQSSLSTTGGLKHTVCMCMLLHHAAGFIQNEPGEKIWTIYLAYLPCLASVLLTFFLPRSQCGLRPWVDGGVRWQRACSDSPQLLIF